MEFFEESIFFQFYIIFVKICVPNNVEPPFMKLKCTRKTVSKKCFIWLVTYAKNRMNKIVFVTNNFGFILIKNLTGPEVESPFLW